MLARFLSQFNNLLIYVLLGSAVVTALLQHWVDTGVILAVVLINAVFGFVQEGRAEKALDAVKAMVSSRANVLRDGLRMAVPAEELVAGDCVLLEAGDRVPADLRLRASSLKLDEAMLTGNRSPSTSRPIRWPPMPLSATAFHGLLRHPGCRGARPGRGGGHGPAYRVGPDQHHAGFGADTGHR
jgi:magnesium-transporting ATPase (P-type)